MTSLTPGTIFQTTGFNRNSTPTPPNSTPAMLQSRYNRSDFDGRPWPHDSPVSRVYDVQNTSTKMIILNNKYGKSGTRLRGYYTGPKKPDRTIDPERHRAPSPRNLDHHVSCYNSSSPKFEPAIRVNLDWYDSSQRSENALADRTMRKSSQDKAREELRLNLQGVDNVRHKLKHTHKRPSHGSRVKASVNPTRHMSCQTPRETLRYQPEEKQRVPIPPAKFFSAKEFSDMSLGEKIYMWSIERIYNVENLKKLKQDQYKKLLQLEAKKGYHGFQEYQKYMRYINSASSRTYGTGSPRSPLSPAGSRSRSAFSARSGASSPTKSKTKQDGAIKRSDNESGDQQRPKTAMGLTQPESPTKKEADKSPKENESEQKAMQPKSPSPSRKSSAKSARSVASTRSIKSRSSSRPSSRGSSKHSESLPRADHSDSSLSIDGETDSKHKEGRDRPKSRLGHKSAEDRDKGAIHSSLSSLSSIRSDKHSSSDDSGLEKDKAKPKKKDSLSNSSRGSRASGSNISLGSRKSDTGPRPMVAGGSKKSESDKQETNKDKMTQENNNKDTTVHNVPSGSTDKQDTTKEVQETKPEAKEAELEEQKNQEDTKEIKNEIKEESNETKELKIKFNEDVKDEHESKIQGNGGQDHGGNPQEVKTESPSSTVDENKETNPAESTNKPIERQDSLEEADIDRRVNKDLDKIEY